MKRIVIAVMVALMLIMSPTCNIIGAKPITAVAKTKKQTKKCSHSFGYYSGVSEPQIDCCKICTKCGYFKEVLGHHFTYSRTYNKKGKVTRIVRQCTRCKYKGLATTKDRRGRWLYKTILNGNRSKFQ